MKKIKSRIKKHFPVLFLTVMALVFTSCSSEFDVDAVEASGEPPVIQNISEAREDIPVTQAVLGGTYIVRGENLATLTDISINGYPVDFNPALTTDELTFITIPEEAPFVGQENVLRLENLSGATEYDFSLLTIEDFTSQTVDGVKTVTLIGGDFSETTKVTFVSGSEEEGNLEEKEAEILSVSETAVTVAVPSGIEQAYIYLETEGGAVAQSDSYGLSYPIYIDELNSDWSLSQWGGTYDAAYTDIALGENSIQSVRDAWSGITFTPVSPIPFDEYEAITVSIYGTGAPGDLVKIALNDFEASVLLELVPGEWTTYVIPLRDFYPNGGAPAFINRIDFQEASNTAMGPYTFYIDDFGFL